MSESEEIEENEQNDENIIEDKPRFVLVEVTQLEKLLKRCPQCGKLPGGKKTGKSRAISWKKSGRHIRFFQN